MSDTNTTNIDEMGVLVKYLDKANDNFRLEPSLTNRLLLAFGKSGLFAQQLKMDQAGKEMQSVIDYLTQVDQWGEFELMLYIMGIPLIEPGLLMRLFNRYLLQASWYQWLAEVANLRFSVCFSLFSCMMEKKQYAYATQVLKEFDLLLKEDESARFSIMKIFLHGWFDFVVNNKTEGLAQCKTVLNLTATLELKDAHNFYQTVYAHFTQAKPSLLIFILFF